MHHYKFKLFGTWKNKLTCAQSIKLAQEIRDHVQSIELPFELSLCPPMIALEAVAEQIQETVTLTAQNLIWDDIVSFTGETSAEALKELGCKYVLIGHSERKIYLGETDSMMARKLKTAVKHSLIPLIYVGEVYEDYKRGLSEHVVRAQMDKVLLSLRAFGHPPKFVMAYEPTWAISTGREQLKCEPTEANQRHQLIRNMIRSEWGSDFAESISIIYGGSINSDNAADYLDQEDIDGGLAGTASQTRESFIRLIDVFYDFYKRQQK